MSGNEHFCLRWNDFESNISHAFQTIREEKDFFDVTLACEDDQVQAHKVILSACSPFFKKVLRKNPHQHPLLFLKGVKYSEIVSILNFMYHGEVNVTQDNLNGFLAVAEDLKVKGLTQSDQTSSNEGSKPASKPMREPPDIKESQQKRMKIQPMKNDDIQEVPMPVKTEPVSDVVPSHITPSYSNEHVPYDNSNSMIVESQEESYDQGYDYSGYEDDVQQYETSQGAVNSTRPDGNKDSLGNAQDPEELIYFDRDPTPGSKKNWRCKLCGEYAHNRGNAMNHVEAKHLNVNYNCDQCNKSFRSRNSLKTHVSTYHGSSGTGDNQVSFNQSKFHGHQSYTSPPIKYKQDYYSENY